MEAKVCYKCKSKKATVNTRFLSCIDCFNLYIENNVKKEVRTGPIEKLKKFKFGCQSNMRPRLELYVALGFGLSSQAILDLLSRTSNTGKIPEYYIKSFINVDTSPLVNKDPSEYYESVNSYIESKYFNVFDTGKHNYTPKLHVIPFCSSFICDEASSDSEQWRQMIIDEIKVLISRGSDHVKLLIQLIILRDIKCYLDRIDSSQHKCLVLASTSESMGSESLQYMTLASGIHIKSIYDILDSRWPSDESVLFLIRPFRNLTLKEVILYWRFNISNFINSSIGAEISINRSPIEDEVSRFVISQNEKISNITHIFVKLNKSSKVEHWPNDHGVEKKIFCLSCGVPGVRVFMHKYCRVCHTLLKKLNILDLNK
ncbi:C2C2-like finger protein [Cryptosporidium canis]|uniref:C2C2-like finger protein n=1 Tax=Cryptosporidium canis TaxID=195482 RepID=A0A9D5DEB6_9CRYT|nr:C2C2-like finger protein [Cryptosporidium canis]